MKKCLLLVALFLLASGSQLVQSQRVATGSDADVEALAKAARTEDDMMFYSAVPENVAKRVSDAFTAKYGVRARFIRLTSNALQQRYAAEAEAGNIPAAFIIIAGNGVPFAEQGIKRGWMDAVVQAGLPVLKGGEFPAKFLPGPTAVVQITPWLMYFNTDKVKGADIPREWTDLTHPKWKGQFILPDPRISDAYYDVWAMLLDKYGEKFFEQLRSQNMRLSAGGTVSVQALAAAEGSVAAPTTMAIVRTMKDKGAPVDTYTPDFTTGLEVHLILTARGRTKQPNAARLFANYLMSPEGNKVFNDDPGNNSVYDVANLPKQYQSPKPGALARKDQILKLLGLN